MRSLFVGLIFLSSPALAQESTTALLPVDLPDTERRVIVDFQVGFNPVFTGLSGNPDTLGMIPADGAYQDSNLFLDGYAALGTHGILWPTLNVYGLGTGSFDLRGLPGTIPQELSVTEAPAVNPSIAHRFGDARALLLHLAYAELEGVTEDGILGDFHLRAGRQFHFSRAPVTFDGATLGYDGDYARAAFRIGSRSAVFDRTQGDNRILGGGLLIGGNLGASFGASFPLSFDADVLHYQRTITLFGPDRALEGGATEIEQNTTVGDLRVEYASSSILVYAAAEFTFPEISHARAGASFEVADVTVLLDFDQKIGTDLTYDIAAGPGLERRDRRTTYETFRLNFVDPQPYSDLDASISIPIARGLEIAPSGGFRIAYGDAAQSSAYDATHVRYALRVNGDFRLDEASGLEAELGFQGMDYFRGSAEDANFRDRASGGEKLSHEVFAGLRYARGGGFRGARMLADRNLSAGLQGFARFSHFDNRYLEQAVDDAAYGVGADVLWQFTRYTGVRLAYEFAHDSSVFYDYLDAFHAVRVDLKGSF